MSIRKIRKGLVVTLILIFCAGCRAESQDVAMDGDAKSISETELNSEMETIAALTELQPANLPKPTERSHAPEPDKTPDPMDEWISRTLDDMSVDEKIGQLFIYRLKGGHVYGLNDETRELITDLHPGGFIFFAENIDSQEQLRQLIEALQAETRNSKNRIPMFISIDEEGGSVSRLSRFYESGGGSSYALGQIDVPTLVFDRAKQIGSTMRELGFNMDFAPVADVWSNPENNVIGRRAYSDDPDTAGRMVAQFVKGLNDEGIISVIKHFPGHGDTGEDSHYGTAVYKHNIERMREFELLPFRMGIEAGAMGVMIGHISTPEITGNNEPAMFSPMLLQDILRGELDFNGLIITDAMEMGAVTKHYDSGTAAVKAFLAGVDILLIPENPDGAYNGIRWAYESGEITEERLDESVKRILKAKYHMLTAVE